MPSPASAPALGSVTHHDRVPQLLDAADEDLLPVHERALVARRCEGARGPSLGTAQELNHTSRHCGASKARVLMLSPPAITERKAASRHTRWSTTGTGSGTRRPTWRGVAQHAHADAEGLVAMCEVHSAVQRVHAPTTRHVTTRQHAPHLRSRRREGQGDMRTSSHHKIPPSHRPGHHHQGSPASRCPPAPTNAHQPIPTRTSPVPT